MAATVAGGRRSHRIHSRRRWRMKHALAVGSTINSQYFFLLPLSPIDNFSYFYTVVGFHKRTRRDLAQIEPRGPIQSVAFHQRDAGPAVHPAHDRGVVART